MTPCALSVRSRTGPDAQETPRPNGVPAWAFREADLKLSLPKASNGVTPGDGEDLPGATREYD